MAAAISGGQSANPPKNMAAAYESEEPPIRQPPKNMAAAISGGQSAKPPKRMAVTKHGG